VGTEPKATVFVGTLQEIIAALVKYCTTQRSAI
jgi:hypothetical protein